MIAAFVVIITQSQYVFLFENSVKLFGIIRTCSTNNRYAIKLKRSLSKWQI